MYQAYWQLKDRPFESASHPGRYYPSESHQGALLKLRYAVENRRGAALLTGDAGVGKTLLARWLAEQLQDRAGPFVHVVFPLLPPDQLLAYLAHCLAGHADSPALSMGQSVRQIELSLQEHAEAGRHVTVVLDEAHALAERGGLEMLRLLLNFEYEGAACLTMLLVGQCALRTALEQSPEFDQRIDVKCRLQPFSLEETFSYVHHRLAHAGAVRPIFDDRALETVHRLAQGVPRRINRLCDLALLIGFAEGRPAIGPAQVEAVAEELELPLAAPV